MTTRFLARGLALLAASGLFIAGCGADDADDTPAQAAGGDGPTIAAAFYPLAFVAERVAGDHASVESLTQPGVESHDLELTGRQVGTVVDADVVVYLEGYQPAVDAAIEQDGSGVAFDVATVVDLIPDDHDDHGHDDDHDDHGHDDDHDDHGHDDDHDDHGHDDDHDDHGHDDDHDDHGHDHDHGDLDGDPHLWLDPTNMALIADGVADALSDVDPDHADTYRANAEQLRAELEELDDEYQTGLAQCERTLIVVSHEAFGYLAHRYGLDQLGVAGIDPDAEPSAARVAQVHDTIREQNVTTIFYERLTSPDVVEAIAGDLGLETAVLDPIEGLTDETIDEDYFSLMRSNLDALRAANGC
ncbi:metal ABC transporter substrate-binding protein [Phytoactinopolyspora limicola]|uniref:metal ABC transporter substrate-binding protein n=1 Tax=Phytoactinopolyspora limicola TaxID=2715536 RepID=UPI00140762E5|nr:metal ABC transporter substrate-binding protein [Phytoactinopolyspora limicola]